MWGSWRQIQRVSATYGDIVLAGSERNILLETSSMLGSVINFLLKSVFFMLPSSAKVLKDARMLTYKNALLTSSATNCKALWPQIASYF